MKGKFRILGRIGLGVFMVCALMLAFMPVAPVSAATEVTDVWVEFDASGANATADTSHANVYYVHFKPATALSRGVDTVTVYWPDGSEAMGGDGTTNYAFTVDDDTGTTDATLCLSDTEIKFSTDWGTTVDNAAADPSWYQCTIDATSAGYRTKITTPIDIAAGQDVWMWIDSGYTDATLGIETPADGYEGTSFKVKVATSQDTTPVLSSTFALGDAGEQPDTLSTSVITSIAGAAAQYTFSIDPSNAVSSNTGKVTVKFPVGTTVPSPISAVDIQFSTNSGTDYSTCAEDPVVDSNRRMITAVTPVTLDDDALNRMKILSSAGITNPTIADAADGTYKCMVRTTADDQWLLQASGYAITAGSANKVAIANGEIGLSATTYPYSDDVTMVNMLSGYIYVYIGDKYGNTVDCSSSSVTVTPSSSSDTGSFYKSDNDSAGSGTYSTITTITVDASGDPTNSGQQVFYCDSTAGTHTLTFSATDYTNAEWTVTCAPVISLYDANDTLVNTYGATSTSLVSELGGTVGSSTTQMYGGDYLTNAINAAMAGDTIKLGDGIYEQDAVITLNKKVTLTSVNGASHTTLRPTTEALGSPVDGAVDASLNVTADGTSSNPIIIDGLTFTRLRSGTEFDSAVFNDGYDYVTVRNCVFNYIDPDRGQQNEAVIYYRCMESGNITSATVSNNTFNNCCSTWPNPSAGITANIFFTTSSTSNAFSGITISGNTLTNCNGYGVTVQGSSGYTITGSITNNTLTNPDRGIYISDWTDLTTGASVTGNTITGAYHNALRVEGSNNGPITIKNNTITGCVVGSYGAVRIDNVQYIDPTYKYVYVQYNDIYDNSSPYGLSVDSATSTTYQYIDCRYNWFGDASGPAYTALTGATIAKSNPNGTGDAISDDVWYYPWLHKPVADVVADNASYQTSTMKLVTGWNTLSTPVPLIAAADTVQELIPSGMSIGYYYDGGWTQITSAYTLSPCDAVYVKMDEAKYVQLKFETKTFSTPSKALAVGWNLCSLASLASSGKQADLSVASVYKTPANLPGYAQVISPSLNANRYDMYYNAGGGWTYSSGETWSSGTMYAGMGYWIYMQNACTLVGFEITPIAPDLD